MVSLVNPNPSLKGKPHWRRTQEVYAVLNTAPSDVTYDRLIEYVRVQTGKGCSRKLISKWKKTVNGRDKACLVYSTVSSKPIQNNEDEPPTGINKSPSLVAIPSQQVENNLKTTLENNQAKAEKSQNTQFIIDYENEQQSISAIVLEPKLDSPEDLIKEAESKTKNSHSISDRVSQVAKNTWSYVAATAIVCGIVGSSWFFSKDNSKPVIAQPTTVESIQNSSLNNDIPVTQNRRVQNGIPRTFKISLTVTSPQDLKVKPGDEIALGQVLSDRTTERQRLLAQKKQLEISLKKLDLPIPEITQPKPIPVLSKLPPVSYQQEEANIALKQQELAEAEKAIVNQQVKIKELESLLDIEPISNLETQNQNELAPNQEQINNQPIQFELQKLSPNTNSTNENIEIQKQDDREPFTVKDQQLPIEDNSIPNGNELLVTDNWSLDTEKVTGNRSLITVIEHEQSILSKLKANREQAKLQLDIAKSKLIEAKEQRAYIEYQRYVEENKKAIALQQQQIELERQRSIRAGQIQEREYSKAQIETKIQEIDNAITQLSTVKAPYAGKLKKVKWTGQDNHSLTVQLTLVVDNPSEKPRVNNP